MKRSHVIRTAALAVLVLLFAVGAVWQHARISVDIGTAVAGGIPSGWTAQADVEHLLGHNQDSDTTEDSCWDGSDFGGPIRCFDVMGSTPQAVYLSSDDENDAAVNITVEHLNSLWAPVSTSVALGSASASGTVFAQIGSTPILRINRMYPTTTAVVGNVYAGIDTADGNADGIPDTILTDLVAVIDLVEQNTMQACYTVPLGFTALLTEACVDNLDTAADAAATFRLRSALGTGGGARTHLFATHAETIHSCWDKAVPLPFVEKTDIEMTNDSSANDASVVSTLDLLVVPNSL